MLGAVLSPRPLRPSAILAVVAPSGPFDAEQLRAGLGRLSHYAVRVPETLWSRRLGYLAGTDTERQEELQQALDDPGIDGIVIARGGFGLGRIISGISWDAFRRHPKWLIGFSDATVLHARLWSMGFKSLHAPNATTLARVTERDFAALDRALCATDRPTFDLETVRPGSARGVLLGGNLTVLFTEAVAGRLQLPKDTLLFVEDVSETSYRVDRMLDALWAGGHLKNIVGMIFGDFTDCSPGRFGVDVLDVLRSFAERLSVPVVTGLPVGHGLRNYPLTLGTGAQLEARPRVAQLRLNEEPPNDAPS